MAQICIYQIFLQARAARRGGAVRPAAPPPRSGPNPGRLAKIQVRGEHADVPAGEAAAARRGSKKLARASRRAGRRRGGGGRGPKTSGR